ncbi:hypothetical protein D3C84_1174370 [compost metagenome]
MLICVDLSTEELRVRRMADRYEDTVCLEDFILTSLVIFHFKASNALITRYNF